MKFHFCLFVFTLSFNFLLGQVNRQAALHFNEAVMSFKANNYEGAIDAYNKALVIDPNYAKARYNRAKAFLRIKSYENAIGDLNLCLKSDPTLVNAWKYKGYAFMQLKNYPAAINSYNKALNLDGSLNGCRTNRGIAFLHEGKYKEASIDLRTVLKSDPGNGSVLFNLAVCQSKLKDIEGALSSYTRLISAGYKTEVVAKERAKILLNKEQYADAINDLDLTIAKSEKDFETFYLRGYCKMKISDMEGANEDFKEALNLNNKHKPSIQNKAFTSFKLADYEEAVVDFSRVLDISPDDSATRVNRGLSSLKLKDYNSAYDDFSFVIETDPLHATAFYNRASAALGLQKNDLACQDMRQAARLGYQEAFDHIRQICKDN